MSTCLQQVLLTYITSIYYIRGKPKKTTRRSANLSHLRAPCKGLDQITVDASVGCLAGEVMFFFFAGGKNNGEAVCKRPVFNF